MLVEEKKKKRKRLRLVMYSYLKYIDKSIHVSLGEKKGDKVYSFIYRMKNVS